LVRHLESRYEKDPFWTTRLMSGDDSASDEIILLACRETSEARDDYEAAFDAFPNPDRCRSE
jgi:hypothetical protein